MTALANEAAVSAVRPSEEESALAPLVLAFAGDPAVRWMYPDALQFRLFFPRFIRALGERAFAGKTAQQVDAFRGTALWLEPGVTADQGEVAGLVQGTVPNGRCTEVLALITAIEAHRPTEPHWHLPLIGIDPIHCGNGLGSKLMGQSLANIDREPAPVYAVASSPRSLNFYQRHGFQVRSEVQAGTSPSLFALIRPAR